MTNFKSFAAGLFLTIASIAVSAGSAQAVLISANDTVFGVDSITQDTDSGLEWLDLTSSTNRSFNDVSGQFGAGGDFAGWRYSNFSEVTALFAAGGVTGNTAPEATILALIAQLGNTLSVVNDVGTQGYFDDGTPNANGVGFAQLSNTFPLPPGAFVILDSGLLPNQSTSGRGNFLVRNTPVAAVPEPSMLILFGSGLVLLGAKYRRKRGS